jgi:hypothetical protein
MRPTPAEVVAGVRQILKEVIEPEIQSDYARSRLAEVRAVLAQVNWDDSITLLSTANAQAGALARRALRFVDLSAVRQEAFADCREGLEQAAAAPAAIEPFAGHAQRDHRLSLAMIDLAERLSDWLTDHHDDAAGDLLDSLRHHYSHPPRDC